MDKKVNRKKWTSPKIISFGKLTELEQNDQISDEMKQYLILLRDHRNHDASKKETPKSD